MGLLGRVLHAAGYFLWLAEPSPRNDYYGDRA